MSGTAEIKLQQSNLSLHIGFMCNCCCHADKLGYQKPFRLDQEQKPWRNPIMIDNGGTKTLQRRAIVVDDKTNASDSRNPFNSRAEI